METFTLILENVELNNSLMEYALINEESNFKNTIEGIIRKIKIALKSMYNKILSQIEGLKNVYTILRLKKLIDQYHYIPSDTIDAYNGEAEVELNKLDPYFYNELVRNTKVNNIFNVNDFTRISDSKIKEFVVKDEKFDEVRIDENKLNNYIREIVQKQYQSVSGKFDGSVDLKNFQSKILELLNGKEKRQITKDEYKFYTTIMVGKNPLEDLLKKKSTKQRSPVDWNLLAGIINGEIISTRNLRLVYIRALKEFDEFYSHAIKVAKDKEAEQMAKKTLIVQNKLIQLEFTLRMTVIKMITKLTEKLISNIRTILDINKPKKKK